MAKRKKPKPKPQAKPQAKPAAKPRAKPAAPASKPEAVELARRRRHIWLLERLRDNKTLTRAELRELESYDSGVSLASGYEAKRDAAGEVSREESAAGRDIGYAHAPVDVPRRQAAEASFKTFCETYFPRIFFLPWSPDHLRVIDKIEKAVRTGGLFAMAMPRGYGKTVLCQVAVLWAALLQATPFVSLIAASATIAQKRLDTIKIWLETNELLDADYNEVTMPIRKLERIAARQKGQHQNGVPTRIEWTGEQIVLPECQTDPAVQPVYKSVNTVISCAGMEGSSIRGQNHARPDGTVVRPQLAFVDDPQTRISAGSPLQNQTREEILSGDVLYMPAPGRKIAGLMACTVIRQGDMADNMLDRDKHPEWMGERTKMVYAFPTDEKLWQAYREMRQESFRNDGDGSEATEFYRQHRTEMDAGAEVAWPEKYNDDEISAVQNAMNLRYRDEPAFFAECQNEPLVAELGDEMMTADGIAAKVNGYSTRTVPINCTHLTMFVDVQQKALFYVVCAWEENFTGYVIDYGTWPDQHRNYFSLRDMNRTMARATPGAGLEGQIYSALDKLTAEKLAKPYVSENGTEMHVTRCLIDANWGRSTEVIYQFCRQSAFASVLMPSHGRAVGAKSRPFAEYTKKRGERIGPHWRIPVTSGRRNFRYVLVDVNYWKSFVHTRFAVAMGDPGCLSLYGRDPKRHRLFAEHLTAEYRVQVEANNRRVDEWQPRPNHADNHWFDCMVGCAVAASIQGVAALEQKTRAKKKKRGGVVSMKV